MGAAKKTPAKRAHRKKPAAPKADRIHRPTPETRRTVEAMVGFGVSQDHIAAHLRIGANTLRRKYRTELDRGVAAAHAQVGQALFRMAAGSKAEYDASGRTIRAEVQPVVAATIFYAKTRMGFQEVQRHQHSGPDADKDGKAPSAIPLRLDGLSTPQLEQILSRIAVALETADR